mmetsp:Transcript_33240/g.94544  ORF Transcript_33240/g.94544 Transcript_33240/m.94544 type:complete len:131 (-) Transcript_33240:383-775(-)
MWLRALSSLALLALAWGSGQRAFLQARARAPAGGDGTWPAEVVLHDHDAPANRPWHHEDGDRAAATPSPPPPRRMFWRFARRKEPEEDCRGRAEARKKACGDGRKTLACKEADERWMEACHVFIDDMSYW